MADGEFRASKLMTEAARLYGEAPVAIKLRKRQTLAEIAREIGTGAVAILTGAPKEVSKRGQRTI